MAFWNRKSKSPITQEDELWIKEELQWIKNEIGEEEYFSLRTISPSDKIFDYKFDHSENDAKFLILEICKIYSLNPSNIKLKFFSETPQNFSEGYTMDPSDKMDKSWNSTLGTYSEQGKKINISLELELLNSTTGLIATIAHEIAHYKLLGEDRIVENDEYLTDLLCIVYGFGIFQANSKFSFGQWTGSSHQGWSMQTQGYLPDQIISFVLAKLKIERGEEDSWHKFLNQTSSKYYQKSINYLTDNT
ncbi:MAG: hypothetical protein COA58_05855 [Bacteroidetes bacterium]|nr:MAG: hypothetical protein COA58_05855 [Bacteroidota bacterium]